MSKETIRVVFDGGGKVAIHEMLEDLTKRGSYLSINPSKLTNWIVACFAKKYFKAEREAITQAHFNSRGYLKDAIKSVQNKEDLERVLKETLTQFEPRKSVKKKLNTDEATMEINSNPPR